MCSRLRRTALKRWKRSLWSASDAFPDPRRLRRFHYIPALNTRNDFRMHALSLHCVIRHARYWLDAVTPRRQAPPTVRSAKRAPWPHAQ